MLRAWTGWLPLNLVARLAKEHCELFAISGRYYAQPRPGVLVFVRDMEDELFHGMDLPTINPELIPSKEKA